MSNQVQQLPIHAGLFTWPSDDPQLIGSKCGECNTVSFPSQGSCPKCCSQNVQETLLDKRGKLWTWTVQGFQPKSPPYSGLENTDSFIPYGVGYIELADQVRVESRLTANEPEQLEIGMEMELVIVKFREDEIGNELMTFAFQPVTGSTVSGNNQ